VVQGELDKLSTNSASSELAELPWDPYAEVHTRIRGLDDSGNWEGAVALATSSSPVSGNARFASFDESSGKQLSDRGQATVSALARAGGCLTLAAFLALAAAVIAAVCAWWGLSQRLEEYR